MIRNQQEIIETTEKVRLDPVFIIGYSRSGTTMLRLMLNKHPELFIPKESEYFQQIPKQYRNRIHQIKDIDYILQTIPDYYSSILNKEHFEKLLRENLPGDNRVLLACLYKACAISTGKENARWGDKKPQHWQFVYHLQKWYPKAQFVNIVRDPRDVITSMEKSLPENIPLRQFFPAHIIVAWQWQYVYKTMTVQEKILGNERYLKLRYQDLVSNPKENLEQICDFLHEKTDYISEMLNFYQEARDPKLSDKGEQFRGTKNQVNTQSIGNFRDFLNQQQIEDIEYICGETMAEMGHSKVSTSPAIGRRIYLNSVCYTLTNLWKAVRVNRLLKGSL
ncbi:Sulfotransferase domain superfamily [Hyella patelloides LEGE 07179]|uniref:Sulfotransferase domain superfamily n=1 Tax=Hyella patelloides LEGE 07179 TaxID=945734 RepID=A0A563VVS0_9CYAN|nr:sulfotransferase [Hyella patelloides]VEP15497.1 Sulfotransferase domain superfamily [Hyella patelloides LEGE 07179]